MQQTALPILLVWTGPPVSEWSPTGISSLLECQRKWAWRKIAKVEDAGGAGADLGKRSHGMWERYLATGARPDFVVDKEAAAVASTTLHLLPAPRTLGMQIERHFRFKSANTGLVYHGFKDFSLPPGVPQPQLGLDGAHPVVGDHKTTKSIASYAKSAEDLQDNDPQSILYGLDAMARHASDAADLAWIYAQTKGAKLASPTVTRLHAKHALKVFRAIEDVALEGARILDAGLQPLDLPSTPEACNGFGGCPYRHLCNLSPSERARSRMSNSIIAGLRARVQGTPEPTVTEPAPAAAAAVMSDRDVPAPEEIPERFLPPHGAVNPPESAIVPPPIAAAPPAEEKPKRTRRTKEQMAADEAAALAAKSAKDPSGADAHAHAAPSAEVTCSQEKAQAAADAAVAATFTVDPVAVADAVMKRVEVKVQEIARAAGFTLYVDCIPIGKPARAAARLIEKAQERMLKEHGVPDYRLVDWGKGTPYFIAFVDEQVDGTFDVALDTRSPEGAVLVETLKAKASFVVQGLR